jgi:DNA-binding GntR family transcriptional regulator
MPPADRSPVPPSQRVEADLRRRIEAGEWATGQALPSVGALAAEYRVARNTVAKALRKLEADGLIQIVPSWGTFRQ